MCASFILVCKMVTLGRIESPTIGTIDWKMIIHLAVNIWWCTRTITILVPIRDQDPTVHFTKLFWMAMDPPFLVANQMWAHLVNPWEPSINPVILFYSAHHLKNNDDSPFTSVRFFCFWGCSSFDPIFSGATAVEVVLELRKY